MTMTSSDTATQQHRQKGQLEIEKVLVCEHNVSFPAKTSRSVHGDSSAETAETVKTPRKSYLM